MSHIMEENHHLYIFKNRKHVRAAFSKGRTLADVKKDEGKNKDVKITEEALNKAGLSSLFYRLLSVVDAVPMCDGYEIVSMKVKPIIITDKYNGKST